jgi:hypothetical protein
MQDSIGSRRGNAPTADISARIASGFVLVVMVAGCLSLWIGVPIGAMWLASKLTSSFGAHMPVALALAVPGMIAAAVGLAWLNQLYLRITGGALIEEEGLPVRRHGPLEPMLALCFAVAVVALLIWFFTSAENPAPRVW